MSDPNLFYHATVPSRYGWLCGASASSGTSNVAHVTCPDCRELINGTDVERRLRKLEARVFEESHE